jgi:hypothetical protein
VRRDAQTRAAGPPSVLAGRDRTFGPVEPEGGLDRRQPTTANTSDQVLRVFGRQVV